MKEELTEVWVQCMSCHRIVKVDFKDNNIQELRLHLTWCGTEKDPWTLEVPFSKATKEELDCLKQGSFEIDYKRRLVIVHIEGNDVNLPQIEW